MMLQLKPVGISGYNVLDMSSGILKTFSLYNEAVEYCQKSRKKWIEYCERGTVR